MKLVVYKYIRRTGYNRIRKWFWELRT